MEVKIEKDEFSHGLSQIQTIVEKKDIIPILTHILIETVDDAVKITATNMEISYIGTYPCRVVKEGNIVVNGKKLYEIIKEMPEGEISLKKKENNWVNIKQGFIDFNLVGLPVDEFPKIENNKDRIFFNINKNLIKEMIEKTKFAISDEQNKYNLNGIFLEKISKGKNVIRMTATDGHRLSLIDREMEEKISLEKGIIIPKKGIQEIKRIIEEIKEEEIFLSFTGNTGIIKTKNGVLIINLIEAEFPDYEKFLPEEQENSLILEKNKFVNALRRISTLATQETHSILIKLKDNKIKIHSNNPEFGEAVEEMDIEYKKDKIDIGFNVIYLLEVLRIIKSDHVKFSFNDNIGPVKITDDSDKDFLSIIMPINFK